MKIPQNFFFEIFKKLLKTFFYFKLFKENLKTKAKFTEISMGFRGFSPGRGRDNMRTGRWREEIQFVKHPAAHIALKQVPNPKNRFWSRKSLRNGDFPYDLDRVKNNKTPTPPSDGK